MMYSFVVSKVWGWRQMAKNLRELGAKEDAVHHNRAIPFRTHTVA